MNYSLYAINQVGTVTFDDLLKHQEEHGDLLARSENSGSEGCYVEVARWKPGSDCHSGSWRRYAFRKYFDGDQTSDASLSASDIAWHFAEKINALGNNNIEFIHRLPNWSDE